MGSHGRLLRAIRTVISASAPVVTGAPSANQFAIRNHIRTTVRRFTLESEPASHRDPAPAERIQAAEWEAERLVANMSRDPLLAAAVTEARASYSRDVTDVLLVTATVVETRAVLAVASEQWNRTPSLHHLGDKSYWDLGLIAGARIRLAQTEMGSGGPSGSTLEVAEAIQALRPGAVVLTGIAFGIDPSRQRIGEILVSRRLHSYDLQRVGTRSHRSRVVPRGDQVSPSPRLLDRCRAAAVTWHGCAVHFGLIASGDKLVDNKAFRDSLLQISGDEIQGGEMEGAGLYSAAHRHKVDWIVIKAICDWADGAKDVQKAQRQNLAARNAARFLAHLLRQGGFATL